MLKQFGVITYSLDLSQQGLSITHNLNQLIKKHSSINPIVFYREYYQPAITPMFAMMQEVELWSFPHPVIATSLKTAIQLIKSPRPTKKLFYVTDLEWLYQPDIDYNKLSQIYGNDEIELIARSEHHADIITEAWKKPLAIIPDFYYEDIVNVIK